MTSHSTRHTPATSAASTAPTTRQPDGPDHEAMVRIAAYYLYEKNGCRAGHELDDWLNAESQLAAQTHSQKTKQAETKQAAPATQGHSHQAATHA